MKKVCILILSLIIFNSILKAEISVFLQNVNSKIEAVQNSCSGIKSNIDKIFGLSVATTVSSGLGSVAASGALAVGIMKAKTDKKLEQLKKLSSYELYKEVLNLENKLKEQSALEKKSKVLGNVRTGLMIGATVTNSVSTGTSLGVTLTTAKLAEKMVQCNIDLQALKLAKVELEAENIESKKADAILSVCTGYDHGNIKLLKNLATANAVVSGIGTVTAGVGSITSAMANSKQVRYNDSKAGKKKEKGLNLASNILVGVTIGTNATSTALSAAQISKVKKDSGIAEKCEKVLF